MLKKGENKVRAKGELGKLMHANSRKAPCIHGETSKGSIGNSDSQIALGVFDSEIARIVVY